MTNNIIIMKNLIVDATRDKIFLTLIVSKNIYTCSHENSKINFEKLMILINEFLNNNKISIDKVSTIYENIPSLCEKFKIKKNLINPIYIS